jgi:hypothetical protein
MKKKTWSPHPYLVAAARKVWRWSPERRACLSAVQRGEKNKKKDTRERQCTKCDNWFPFKEVVADHIDAVGKQPREWSEYPAYYARMFCSRSNLQALCTPCHKVKTAADRKKAQV